MSNPAHTPADAAYEKEDSYNLVEIWLRRDVTRWKAGAMAGILAGLVALAFGGVLAAMGGKELTYAVKLAALPLYGPEALRIGMHVGAIACGLIFFEVLSAVLGIVYAHFTGTTALAPLLGMGLAWGAFSWIFINNLFGPAVHDYMAAEVPRSCAFFFWMVHGITLTSVSAFDRMLRK